MLQLGPGDSVSEALILKLIRVRAALEIGEKRIAAKQSRLTTGPELEAEIQLLLQKLDTLDTQAKVLSDEYLTKKAAIEQKAHSKKVGLSLANILVKRGIRKELAKNFSDKKLITSISALDEAYYKQVAINLQEQTAQLTAAIDEHESKLKPIWSEKGNIIDELLPLLARKLETERLANQEVAALGLSPKGQSGTLKQQAQNAGPRPGLQEQSVEQEPTSISQKEKVRKNRRRHKKR